MLLQAAFESLCHKTCPDYRMIPYVQFFFSILHIILQFTNQAAEGAAL